MKQIALVLILVTIMLLGCVSPGEEQEEFEVIEKETVARVIDGDTFVLENGERVRLIGIDTPERGEKCFEEAKNRLQELVFDKDVLLYKDQSHRDKYGRLVRFVYVDGVFVNLVLVEEGFAKAFEFAPDNSLAVLFWEAEERALVGNGCLWNKEGIKLDFNMTKT